MMAESTHHFLLEAIKTALIKIFVSPYATVCDLYCGKVLDEERWDEAKIGHFIGIDEASSGVGEVREAWESPHKTYTSDFYELDPCTENLEAILGDKANTVDIVCCMQRLQFCFETEEKVRRLLHNVSSLLKPGGYLIGITLDSSTLWAKYQKSVEAYHNRSGGMKPNLVPNCIRSESYMITFEVEEEKFPFFGKKYQMKFASDASAETHSLVHFPSLIRLAREAGLEYVEIQNLLEFYDDNKTQFSGMLGEVGHGFLDPKGRLLPKFQDVLGLYTTFIFQKPDPDVTPPLMTPLLHNVTQILDEPSTFRTQPFCVFDEQLN
uniref:mRNA cap guanine-N7 methyltransferase 2 isoform X2 n=1 Tax=Erigeron canadensis TaxID=72917 RepID=UPI001CB90014|nr:mRNA cap guanine-N7 methyltransferase 2 isoform X2 [Erigeron canadensis]